jgi:hypothetical protein
MSNVIITSGGINNGAIEAGGPGTNGPYFPIKYFLLAYDPAIDGDIHTIDGVTSATPFIDTVEYGDTSLIKNGGHYIFKRTNYTISETDFLILNGSETVTGTTIGNSDKSATTTIVLSGGKALIDVVSGSSEADLYSTGIGEWYSENGLSGSITGDTTNIALTGDRDNYFPIESYSPISNGEGQMKGVYKCRVGSSYGNFKFNKIGLYITKYAGVEETGVPVLVAAACLNSTVVKTKSGNNITNLEFDIEIEFHTQNEQAEYQYMTEDYWIRVPTSADSLGLYYDREVAIGTSGSGWIPKAKLDISSEGSMPVLKLNNQYNKQSMIIDIEDSYGTTAELSGISTMSVYTSATHDIDRYSAAFNYYYDEDSVKTGFRVEQKDYTTAITYTLPYTTMIGIENVFDTLTKPGIKKVIGMKSYITNHAYSLDSNGETTGGWFEIYQSASPNATTVNRFGIKSIVNGYGKNLYGSYVDVDGKSTNTGDSIGYYANVLNSSVNNSVIGLNCISQNNSGNVYGIKADITGKYPIGTEINVYGIDSVSASVYGSVLNITGGSSSIRVYGNYILTTSTSKSNTNSYGIYVMNSGLSQEAFGIYSEIEENSDVETNAYAGYFKAPTSVSYDSYALYADGNSYFNGDISSSGDISTTSGNISASGSITVGGKHITVSNGDIVINGFNSNRSGIYIHTHSSPDPVSVLSTYSFLNFLVRYVDLYNSTDFSYDPYTGILHIINGGFFFVSYKIHIPISSNNRITSTIYTSSTNSTSGGVESTLSVDFVSNYSYFSASSSQIMLLASDSYLFPKTKAATPATITFGTGTSMSLFRIGN